MAKTLDVLLCYRGRFQPFVRALAQALRGAGLRVAFDREILDGAPAAGSSPDVEWVSVGDQPQVDTAWRAPLRAAIEAAEMVVFAVAFRDISENVVNEMQWAVRGGAHTFLLVHDGPANLETQGLALSMLAVQFLMAGGGPVYPEFGHHFCGSLDATGGATDGGGHLQHEATIAAHRITFHLARCRAGALRMLDASATLTMDDLARRPEPRARRALRALQAGACQEAPGDEPPVTTPAMQAARAHLEAHEAAFAGLPTPAGRLEQFQRAEDILNRCRPGPHELPGYFSALMMEAAAVEMALHADLKRVEPTALDFRPMVFLGTVPGSGMTMPWSALVHDDLRLLLVDAAFLDLQYQLLKLLVAAAAVPVTGADGEAGVVLDPRALPARLAADPALGEAAWRCLRRYAVEGRPAATVEPPQDPTRREMLTEAVRLAERALVAQGYADFTLAGAPWPKPPLMVDGDIAQATPADLRNLRDTVALDCAMRASRLVGDADPVRTLAGVLTVHCAQHLRQRLIATLTPGSAKWAVETPEQFVERLRALLGFVDRAMAEAGAPDVDRRAALDQAGQVGTALLAFWGAVEPRLRADAAAGLRPLASWG